MPRERKKLTIVPAGVGGGRGPDGKYVPPVNLQGRGPYLSKPSSIRRLMGRNYRLYTNGHIDTSEFKARQAGLKDILAAMKTENQLERLEELLKRVTELEAEHE